MGKKNKKTEYKQKQIKLTFQMENIITLKIVKQAEVTQATFEHSSLIIYFQAKGKIQCK